MDTPISISIIVPCYNAQDTLERCIKSLVNQTKPPHEIVLVDDGSIDCTGKICDRYAQHHDNIIAIHQSNSGTVGAWKRGLQETTGKYILFCDADDYVDSDLVEMVTGLLVKYAADLTLYGMYNEYATGDKTPNPSRLQPGYYNRAAIESEIFPKLYSDGTIESELILKSRWSKAFSRNLLLNIAKEIPDVISFGEDDLVTFCAVMCAESIYQTDAYFPYHCVRNSGSKTGSYDPEVFCRINLLHTTLEDAAAKYHYLYTNQLLYNRLSDTLLYIKKEICRNPNGYRAVKVKLRDVRDSDAFKECLTHCSIRKYRFASKVFAQMIICRMYLLAYLSARLFEHIRGRDV